MDSTEAPEGAGALAPESSTPTPDVLVEKKKKKKKKKGDGGLGTSRGIETMFRTAYRTHLDLTALADTKANIMISINGLILSIILASIAPKIDSNNWLLIPTVVVLISCMTAIIYAVLAARPRVNATLIDLDKVRNNSTNILFFGNYASLSEDDYVDGMISLLTNTDNLYTNMMRDIYGMGKVLTKKFELLRKSYTFFMYGLSISVLAYIIIFMMTTYFPNTVGV
ncbi:MAG: hypothetical protein HKN43_07905 [Rhodothermales bacterium]|nr:hypothetical protein [Rhodothermales bacterium]